MYDYDYTDDMYVRVYDRYARMDDTYDYMDEYKEYSTVKAYKVAEMAKAKGLVLLEGKRGTCSLNPNCGNLSGRGFCVAKEIAGQYLTLTEDGDIFQDHSFGDTAMLEDVWFALNLDEAKKRIESFDGTIKNYPRSFAYVRVYEGEPEYCGYLQKICLNEFAHRHGISYAEKFVCVGGKEDEIWHPDCPTGINDVIDCCDKSFSQITENDYLVVTDFSRLNDNLDIWKNSYNIITMSFEDRGYTEYEYHESEKVRKAIRYFEKWREDSAYEAMCREYEKMMLEQGDQPFIEAEEEQYGECSNEHD